HEYILKHLIKIKQNRVWRPRARTDRDNFVQPEVALGASLEAGRAAEIILRRIVSHHTMPDPGVAYQNHGAVIGSDHVLGIKVTRAVRCHELMVRAAWQHFPTQPAFKSSAEDLDDAPLAGWRPAQALRRRHLDYRMAEKLQTRRRRLDLFPGHGGTLYNRAHDHIDTGIVFSPAVSSARGEANHR